MDSHQSVCVYVYNGDMVGPYYYVKVSTTLNYLENKLSGHKRGHCIAATHGHVEKAIYSLIIIIIVLLFVKVIGIPYYIKQRNKGIMSPTINGA